MSNLDNITARIRSKAQAELEAINEEFDRKIADLEASNEQRIDEAKEKIFLRADSEARNEKEKIVNHANLTARDQVLSSKEEVFNEVISKAKEELRNISDEDYLDFVKKNLEQINLKGNEVLIAQEGKAQALQGLDIEIAKNESIESGFLIKDGDITINFDFNEMVDFYKVEFEGELVSILFGKED